MDNRSRKYLHDINIACGFIRRFTENKTLGDYREDPMLRSAVERQFQIIGEALQKLIKENSSFKDSITEYRDIINFRNILVHGYDMVDDEVVWGVIERSLPTLHKEILALLQAK
jgi:uncharacterized protein with HEPN domain